MAKLIIDLSGIGGLAPRHFGDKPYTTTHPELRIIGTDNQYAAGTVNPIAKLGYLSPAVSTTAAVTLEGDNDFLGMVRATQVDTIDSNFFVAFSGDLTGTIWGVVRKMSNYTGVKFPTADTSDWSGAGTEITDLEIYEVNGVRKLFAAYKQTGGGNISLITISNMTEDEDWLSAACSGGSTLGATNEIKMVVADNGFMYVLDGSTVHKIDGTTNGGANGTATMNVLTFPAIFKLVDAVDVRGNMWIALSHSSGLTGQVFKETVGVYVWDRQSTQANMTDYIPIEGVQAIFNIFSFRGVPACFTLSSTNYTQLRVYNGNEFKVVQELAGNAYPRYPDSVHNTGEMITWLAKDGDFYAYGKVSPEAEDAIHLIGDFTGLYSGSPGTGAIIGVDSTNEAYYLGVRDASNYLMKKWYPNKLASQYPLAGGFYSMVKGLPKLSTINSVTLYYPPTSTTGTTQVLDVNIYFNQSTTSWGTTTLTRADGVRSYKYIKVGKIGVNFIQLGLIWKTGNGMSHVITPSYAEIDYTPSTKKY